MLDGTVKYLGEVLARYRDGLRLEGIVNEPMNPRVPLRESPKEPFLATKWAHSNMCPYRDLYFSEKSLLGDPRFCNRSSRFFLFCLLIPDQH